MVVRYLSLVVAKAFLYIDPVGSQKVQWQHRVLCTKYSCSSPHCTHMSKNSINISQPRAWHCSSKTVCCQEQQASPSNTPSDLLTFLFPLKIEDCVFSCVSLIHLAGCLNQCKSSWISGFREDIQSTKIGIGIIIMWFSLTLLAIQINFHVDPHLSGHWSLYTFSLTPCHLQLQILSPLFLLGNVLRMQEAYYPWPRFPHCMYIFFPGEEMRTERDRGCKCSGYQHRLRRLTDLGASASLI